MFAVASRRVASKAVPIAQRQQKRSMLNWMVNYPDNVREQGNVCANCARSDVKRCRFLGGCIMFSSIIDIQLRINNAEYWAGNVESSAISAMGGGAFVAILCKSSFCVPN